MSTPFNPEAPQLTTEATVVPTHEAPYRRLTLGPGEAHRVRLELVETLAPDAREGLESLCSLDAGECEELRQGSAVTPAQGGDRARAARRLGGLVHFTDFQIADLASPSRVEYLQRFYGDGPWQRMLPAYRPQEFLLPHAIEATIRTVRMLAESQPGAWNAVLTTGDNTDTAQRNELDWFLTYLDGGHVEPDAGSRNFRDAPVGLGDPEYYSPEPGAGDRWQASGFPAVTGALAAAAQPFTGAGVGMPWLTCFGNHDCLIQGRAKAPVGYDDFLTGDSKPIRVQRDLRPAENSAAAHAAAQDPENAAWPSRGDLLDAYIQDPKWVSHGDTHQIAASDARRMVSKTAYVQAHLDSATTPAGHGFTAQNLEDGTTYYVWDGIPGLRLVVLDSTNPRGHVDGCIDPAQYAWLEERLREVSLEYVDAEGNLVTQDVGDPRAVLLASHHGLSTMNNAFGDQDVHLASDLEALVHRYPHVIAWLSGHTHINKITPRPAAAHGHPEGAFWEISTGSISEWPVQSRLLDIHVMEAPESPEAGDAPGAVAMASTMMDLDVSTDPQNPTCLEGLAELHREMAANHAGSVGGLNAHGAVEDRNQVLAAPIPAALASRLASAQA